MYGFMYKDFDNNRWICYDWQPWNLKYCLDAKEADKRYREHEKEMVTITIKRPPNLDIPIQIPLATKTLEAENIDNNFLTYITKWNLSTRMELIMSKFMDNYYLWKDWAFYRREKANDDALKTTNNLLALCMMKDIILGCFRITPLRVPTWPKLWRKKKDLSRQEYLEWDIWDDFPIEYEVQWSKFKTNLFWVYKPKLFEAMLADTGKTFNGFCLQRWQLLVWLLSWWVTYVIWPRSGWKSLYINWDSAGYLLKEITDVNEKIQEFSVLYMWLSQKQNAPYMVYSQKMLNSLIDLPSFCNKISDGTWVYIIDWDRQRKLEYVTTNQNDPTRSRRTRKFVWDEADYLDWDYVATALGTADSLVTLISTIWVDTQAWHFYQGWLNAYKAQRDYEPIDVLIHDIWIKYWMHLCTSRKDYQRKIDNWDFERMRAEFIARRPEVALHFTMDDVEFLTEQQKEVQINKILNARGYDYMLAEYFWEYSTDQTVFNIDWAQKKCPDDCEYWVFGYDEAESYDNPWFCLLGRKEGEYYVKDTWKLPKEPNERFAKMKTLIQEYKNKWKPVYLTLDATRGWAAARELGMLWMPVDMLIKWTGNVTYQPWARHNVWKAWCIDMISTSFFDTNILHIDPWCYWDWWLVEELTHFKRRWVSARGEKKIHDDQVSGLMLCLYFAWFTDQLGTKDVQKMLPQKTNQELSEMIWAERYQKPKETREDFLINLQKWMY